MIYIAIAGAIFLLDFFVKKHMEKTLKDGETKEKLGGRILLRKHHNRGAVLNKGQERQSLVAALSLFFTVVISILFIMTLGKAGGHVLKTGLALLLGGAFSNTYDRLKRKYVVDYLSFSVKWKWLRQIIFNFSDFAIILGAMLTAVASGKE